jgi:tetratricopeptide (TPR) repeat protein
MPGRSTLDRAQSLLRSRKFPQAIKALEGALDSPGQEYRKSFDFYYTLGVAYMYQGDYGGASDALGQARKITMLDPRLIIAQAALLLRRGDTARAVEYYLNALDLDPACAIAKKALEFIKSRGDPETIAKWSETGKIRRFYPPLGARPLIKTLLCLGVILAGLGAAFVFAALPRISAALESRNAPPRADMSALSLDLTEDELKNALETDLSTGVYRYILSAKDITASYAAAKRAFLEYRDNAAQVEINRILNSNASPAIRLKARTLMNYLAEPTFDSLGEKDNLAYAAVAADPYLYQDCYVSWQGRIASLSQTEDGGLRGNLLVDYDPQTNQVISGIVPLVFPTPLDIDPSRSLHVLGRLYIEDKKLALRGKSVYQPLKGD